MIEAQLQGLGLTEGESKVYLALLKKGLSTVGPIVKESGVAYSNIYEILDRLQEKGLVSHIIRSKTRHYQAVTPSRIKEFLYKREQELEEQRQTLKQLVPELELLERLGGTTAEAEVFIGWKGVYSAYMKQMEGQDGKDLFFFYVYEEEMTPRINAFFDGFDEYYIKHKMKVKGISQVKYKDTERMKTQKHLEMRYIDETVPNNIDICGNKTIIVAWSIPIAVLITNKEIAKNFTRTFKEIWEKARPDPGNVKDRRRKQSKRGRDL